MGVQIISQVSTIQDQQQDVLRWVPAKKVTAQLKMFIDVSYLILRFTFR
jgi:hypothetical protein